MRGRPAACVGVHVHAEPRRLDATLAALGTTCSGDVEIVLLPDQPDAATRARLATLPAHRQIEGGPAYGPPACFNRLVRATTADVVVLLESGALPGAGWLERLAGALLGADGVGLAGPSTNDAWNEQCVFPGAGAEAVGATAAEAARRFGGRTRDLGPLHSLADFCYVVRREVVADTGEMDERYGGGPCWEMDYTVRAARAGWRSVFVPGAFVWRAPPTARRARDGVRLFEVNRRRYQDKFCGLRLSGVRTDYEPHCRGDGCEHFAPGGRPPSPPAPGGGRAPAAAAPPAPLVSCVMPTGGRPQLARQAIEYFRRQQLAQRELVILDDGPEDLGRELAGDPRLRYVRAAPGLSIGAKRNELCRLARGEVVVHWDDDDWYGPGRLAAQVEPILAGRADVTALRDVLVFDVPSWRFWRCAPALHRRLFVGDVHGGTLAYRRALFGRTRFPHVSLAEDAAFLSALCRRGARLLAVDGTGLCLYVRHGDNAWAFPTGTHLDPRGWLPAPEPRLAGADRTFYRQLQASRRQPGPLVPARRPAVAPAGRRPARPGGPPVSCIMPTADRRTFLPGAIACFLEQDYARKELVIVDDGDDPVADLVPAGEPVRYLRVGRGASLGAKRNVACAAASGELILHFDDDDWSAPHRIAAQVELLERTGADACGSRRLLYLDLGRDRAWRYEHPLVEPAWVAGNTLCYRAEAWRPRPFRDVGVGEDAAFLLDRPALRTAAVADEHLVVATIHPANASPKSTFGSYWRPCALAEVQGVLGPAWQHIAAAAASPPAKAGAAP